MRSSGHTGGESRVFDRSQAEDQKRNIGNIKGMLYIVGIGPGDIKHLSGRAMEVLREADEIAGYTTYIELIRPLIGNKRIISTSMTKEIDRVEAAIDVCMNGKSCAVVSSGDAGIYAMAGLVFEICKLKKIPIFSPKADEQIRDGKAGLAIEVIPGIPALAAGAALLGAPLTHDFAAISLSDLLTPWEKIEKRLRAAAEADFVIVLYNPRSKKRAWQLERAREIILESRKKNTPVGIVSRAMRDGQSIQIITLGDLDKATVDMQTTVFIGNSTTFIYNDFMVTPRGYARKYDQNKQ